MAKELYYPNLRGEMAKKGYAQKDLCKLLNLCESQVSKRMNGKTEFTIKEVVKICEWLGKSFSELFE